MRRVGLAFFSIVLTAIFLCAIAGTTADAREIRIVFRFETDNPDAKECMALATAGYTHGVEVGMTGEVWMDARDGHELKIATLEVVDADAYMSACKLTGLKAKDRIGNTDIRMDSCEIEQDEYFGYAGAAFDSEDFKKAHHYYSLCDDESQSAGTDLVCERLEICVRRIQEQNNRELTAEEVKKEVEKIHIHHLLAVHYLLYCDFEPAMIYADRILRVDKDHQDAQEIRDMIAEFVGDPRDYEEAVWRAKCGFEDEGFPGPDDFIPLDEYPEMTKQADLRYPRLAERDGVEGVVWVKALVDREGVVRAAGIGKTSGSWQLDLAAVRAAYKNEFKPGRQNGKPVAVWVTYQVDFKMR